MTVIDDKARLYHSDGPNSYRVRIFLAEKGVELPLVRLEFSRGEHKAPNFLKINSLGQVPALVLGDGTIITESVAICRYVEGVVPEPPLFGTGAREAALVEMWSRRVELVVMGKIGNVALHSSDFFRDRLTPFPAFAETERKSAPDKWRWLDREIADGRPFLAGDRFSNADVTGMMTSWLGEVFDLAIPEDCANLRRWDERMRARPSWIAAQ